jgi:hypothetical protein
MVALCSGDFQLYSDASSITPRQLVIELDFQIPERPKLKYGVFLPCLLFFYIKILNYSVFLGICLNERQKVSVMIGTL